jgi:3-hydroxyisobutyrate dehydrogenase-like beta-hydroxyacid dehydrogenase
LSAGPSEAIKKCRSLFAAMGQRTFMISEDASAANLIKLSGNFLTTAVIESLAEGFALVRKAGVDPQKFLEVLTESMFSAPVYKTYGAMIAADKFQPAGFKLPLGFKDNRLLQAAAEEASVPMPMVSLMHDRFVAALAQGLGDADWSAIARVAYKSAGL